MLAPIDLARFTPLICGLPDSLKIYISNAQDCIELNCTMNSAAAAAQAPREKTHITTWSEFVQEIVNYKCRMGWAESSMSLSNPF